MNARLLCLVTALVAGGGCQPADVATSARANGGALPAQGSRPQLLVVIVVDQMRFDYLHRFDIPWTHGLKRLASDGAVFEEAYYPYLNTVTCSGHATIGTGAFPSTHGVILNEWWHRSVNRRMPCTEDPAVGAVPYSGAPERIGHSAHRLRVPTLADRLRAVSPASRIVSLSLKARSAVMMAGKSGDGIAWFTDRNTWGTSTAFSESGVAAIRTYVLAHPVEEETGAVWERSLPVDRYKGSDDGVGERPPRGWTRTFPHPLRGSADAPPNHPVDLWKRSPFADAYVGRMAASLVRSLELGRRDEVDFLAISFSALDSVGHDFGPDSHEVQDTLVHLDRTLGRLFDALDEAVGRDRYVVALSADHGVSEIPEARVSRGEEGGRVLREEVQRVADAAMVAAHGPGPHVAHVEYTDIYLTEAARKHVAQQPAALQPLIDAVQNMPGVDRVMPSQGLEKKRSSSDPKERAAALSYYAGESGDLAIIYKLHWLTTNTAAATHGSMQRHDQHVPVIFMGRPFKPGRYAQPASPADIAPTLASLIKLNLPGVDGRKQSVAIR